MVRKGSNAKEFWLYLIEGGLHWGGRSPQIIFLQTEKVSLSFFMLHLEQIIKTIKSSRYFLLEIKSGRFFLESHDWNFMRTREEESIWLICIIKWYIVFKCNNILRWEIQTFDFKGTYQLSLNCSYFSRSRLYLMSYSNSSIWSKRNS